MAEHKVTSTDLMHRTAIIADDDQITRGLLRTILSVAGLKVTAEAISGERAIEVFKRSPSDVVCIDIEMPGMGGLEALRQIRAMSSQAVLVIISAETTAQNVQQAIESGADGIVAKPFNTTASLPSFCAPYASACQRRPSRPRRASQQPLRGSTCQAPKTFP